MVNKNIQVLLTILSIFCTTIAENNYSNIKCFNSNSTEFVNKNINFTLFQDIEHKNYTLYDNDSDKILSLGSFIKAFNNIFLFEQIALNFEEKIEKSNGVIISKDFKNLHVYTNQNNTYTFCVFN